MGRPADSCAFARARSSETARDMKVRRMEGVRDGGVGGAWSFIPSTKVSTGDVKLVGVVSTRVETKL